MPVLECSCGMVMSVAASDPRNSCIRCGVELLVLEGRKLGNADLRHSAARQIGGRGHERVLDAVTIFATATNSLSSGYYI